MARTIRPDWREIAEAFFQSGKTQSDYADAVGVSVWTLRYWLSKLKDEFYENAGADENLGDLLIKAAERHGGLTSRQVADALYVPMKRARKYLGWLVEEGALEVRGDKHGRYFVPVK